MTDSWIASGGNNSKVTKTTNPDVIGVVSTKLTS